VVVKDSWGQFHQHFTRGFFVRKFCTKLFVLEVKVKLFIDAKKMAQLHSKNVGEIDSWSLFSVGRCHLRFDCTYIERNATKFYRKQTKKVEVLKKRT
jgi:hypothetical protein